MHVGSLSVGVNRLQLNWVYGCCFCLEKEELFPQLFFGGGGGLG